MTIQTLGGITLVAALAVLTVGVSRSPRFSGLTFTSAVATCVAAALCFPYLFLMVGGYKLTGLIVPLIQIIMFGMGTTLSLGDFARVLVMPRGVLVGLVLQFGVMPVTGYTLAHAVRLHRGGGGRRRARRRRAGGVASNVMTYLAGGNVALSVTMTAFSTLLSPVLTPLAMQWLAGRFVPIDAWAMMISILQMIIIPIVAGLVFNRLLRDQRWMPRLLPIVSMAAICTIILIITASSRDQLLAVALTLLVVVVLHNLIGFTLGYWGARGLGLNESDSRTASIEVGLQNAGMASGIAISVLHSSDAGLAAAIFGPWMNAAGSVLASYWRQRPPRD